MSYDGPTQFDARGSAESCSPPSRNDNPFATCWTRPGALAFRFSDQENQQRLVAKLATQNWWGAIVGPQGSGKSTLLQSLKPCLVAAGLGIHSIALHDGQRRLSREMSNIAHEITLIIVDGYEQLGWFDRLRLKRRCRQANAGLLVTTHAAIDVPTLITLAPDEALVHQLVAELSAKVSTQTSRADVTASHACHGSNVREIFFDLYDRHERLRQTARTRALVRT